MNYNYLFFFGLCVFLSPLNAQFSFTESAQNMGIFHQSVSFNYGGAVSVSDFNGDGFDDITLGSRTGDTIQFYQNIGGIGFQRISLAALGLGDTKQILWADYDNDGDQDLFIATHLGQNRLYQNTGNLNLVDVTLSAGLPQLTDPTWTAAWGDYNRDGFLDLIITNYVYATGVEHLFEDYLLQNNGNGSFTVVNQEVGLIDYNHSPLAVAFMDYNNDLWPDLFIASDKAPANVLLENTGIGKLRDISIAANVNQVLDGMSAGIGDYDGDGYLDIYVTNSPELSPGGSILLKNDSSGIFTERSNVAGVDFNGEGWAANFIDFDNDGDLDLYVSGAITNGTPNGTSNTAAMYDNRGNDTFVELLSGIGMAEDTKSSYAHAIGDFNNDGFADIIVNNRAPDSTQLWMHNTGTNNWINIKLQGTASNRDGIGAWIKAYTDGLEQVRYTHHGLGFMGQNTTDGLFGMDTVTVIDSINIWWPSGHKDQLVNVNSNQSLTIVEGSTAAVSTIICSIGEAQICTGGNIDLYVAGQFAQYLWSTGATTHSISTSTVGMHSVTVTDAFGATTTTSFMVNAAAPLLATVNPTSLLCDGDFDGIAIGSATGGIDTSYHYLWSNGSQNSSIQNLTAGTYWFVAWDDFGCRDTATFQITAPAPISVNDSIVQLACYGDSTAAINLTVSGGVASYSYLWSNGSTMNYLTDLQASNYTVTIQDGNACTLIWTDTLSQPLILSGTLITSPDTMGMGGTATALITGGTAPYSYLWSNGMTTSTILGVPAGLYSLLLTDSNGCTDSFSTEILSIQLTGIDQYSVDETFLVFPNPAKDNIHINILDASNDKYTFQIIDILGRVLLNEERVGVQQIIAVKALKEGVFTLVIYNQDKIVYRQMIKLLK